MSTFKSYSWLNQFIIEFIASSFFKPNNFFWERLRVTCVLFLSFASTSPSSSELQPHQHSIVLCLTPPAGIFNIDPQPHHSPSPRPRIPTASSQLLRQHRPHPPFNFLARQRFFSVPAIPCRPSPPIYLYHHHHPRSMTHPL